MYCAPTHPAPQKIILGTLLNDIAFFKERNLAKYLHTEFAHIPALDLDPHFMRILKTRFLWQILKRFARPFHQA